MRNSEIINGNPVFTPDGRRVGNSKTAAFTGIFLTSITRLAMAVPGMTLVPFLTNAALQRCIFCPNSPAIMPFQLFWVGLCATIATPLCLAFFKQKSSFDISSIEPPLKDQALKLSPKTNTVYYNKGL